jgi:acyl-[acyl carrier protein]--UDP-N-acetylglucosamine O-acyltransferase
MAVNKNFVVKNGLEVDTNTLFVDSANNRVAIGTTVPTAALDVRGKILSDSQVESWVGKFVGIVTAGAVGVTTLTYSVGTGSSTKLGRANAEELNVTAGFTTVQSMSATDIIVSVGSTFSKDVNIGAAATVGAALTVTGGAKIALDSRFEKALEIGEDLNVGAAATITGISTFTGAAKFAANSRFEKSLAIGEDLNVGGATTVGGALTVTGNAYFNGNVDVGGDLTFDEVNARNATITGIATVGFSTSANAYIAGITTSSLLHVGMGATMVKVQGTPATRVGINSIGPAFTLDVDGDINSTGTVRQAGTSVLTTASGDATALAIALG